LKAPAGIELFRKLVKTADVVIENYRPDVKDRLGIDYASLRAINPRIVLASISGFGQDGPYRDRPGFDQIAQGLCGLMSVTGFADQGPLRAGAAVADVTAGLLAALGIMTALAEREVTGEGQWVQSNLLQAGITLLDFQAARYTMSGEVPGQVGNDHPTSMPTSAYRTADGHLNVAASGTAIWLRLCEAIGRPDLPKDARFLSADDRSRNRAALADELNAALSVHTSADPQVQHLKATARVEHPILGSLDILAQPIKLSRTPAAVVTATPERGAHTDEVLRELGMTEAEIQALRTDRIVV
jgi:crotonobetainyl-CoA:carnitine CoA-transferase CaiB-like acyl-CoA transferase